MNKAMLRKSAAILVILLTLSAFIVYFINNPNIWQQIKTIPLTVFITVIVLYLISMVALAYVTIATIRLCKLSIHSSESLLLTMYTAIVNFFGPLQSGPAFRGVYLKQKHGLSLKLYAIATSVYYIIWGVISLLLLFSGILRWWLIPIGLFALGTAVALARSNSSYGKKFQALDMRGIFILLLATVAQILLISAIYYVELNSVASNISYSQVLIYTGAANLALFVSITPGAVGFREAFLLFSQRLHHISTEAIVAANTIDRAMYFVVLGLLAIYIFGTHATKRLGINSIDK